MVNDFTIPTAATAAPATSTAASTAPPDPSAAELGKDFIAVLAEALTAEAAAASLAPTAPPAANIDMKQDEIDASEELLDAQAMFADPQALMLSLENSARTEAAVTVETASVPALDSHAERAALTAFSVATAAVGVTAASSATTEATASVTGDDQAKVESTALFDAVAKAVRNTREAPTDSKPERSSVDSTSNMLAANVTHERVAELRDQPVIRSHVGTATWTEELAGKLTVMVGRGLQSASLKLTPEHLGPMEIRISVQNEQASVWFGAAHADTRTALEQALPRLRELLAGQGLNLSDAGVFRETPRQPNKQYSNGTAMPGEGEREFSIAAVRARGMVDAYA